MRSNPKSAPPPAPRRLTQHDAKTVLMGMATASTRPLLVGVAAVRLGILWTIDETEALFAELVDEGKLRPLNSDEQRSFDLREGFVVAGVDLRK